MGFLLVDQERGIRPWNLDNPRLYAYRIGAAVFVHTREPTNYTSFPPPLFHCLLLGRKLSNKDEWDRTQSAQDQPPRWAELRKVPIT